MGVACAGEVGCCTPAMVLPMKTGIMLWTIYLPTDTGAPTFMPKGICSKDSACAATQGSPVDGLKAQMRVCKAKG